MDVAEQLRPTPFYNEGRLVRLGNPQSSHLEKMTERCPLVLLDKIAANLGESLSKEKRDLEEEKVRLDGILEQYNTILQAIQRCQNAIFRTVYPYIRAIRAIRQAFYCQQ